MVARLAGGARYGTRDWLYQRATALYMLLFGVAAFVYLLVQAPSDYPAWRALLKHSPIRIATLIFFLALFVHSWVGMRNVLMDYVRNTGARLALHAIVITTLVAYFFWAVQILWML